MRASHDRLTGFEQVLTEHAIPLSPEDILDSEFTFDGGYTAARLFLERSSRPTAIFAGNDEAAYGVLFAAHEVGLDVPGQLSICGYDDFAMSKNIWPGLTTVHQPTEELIETATRVLIQILKGRPPESNQIFLPSQLVLRGSSAPPPPIR